MKLFKTVELRGKTHPVTYDQVAEVYRKVQSNGGAAGADGVTLEAFGSSKVKLLCLHPVK